MNNKKYFIKLFNLYIPKENIDYDSLQKRLNSNNNKSEEK